MARPAEKARAMLNKWTAMRNAESQGPASRQHRPGNRRPHLASECEYLADAERFRGQIVKEIGGMMAKIQNPALAEHEIRELNDGINHRMREKWHWNRRIKELGGSDYNAIERQRQVEQGDAQMYRGYRYYGAAKDLPGVRELLAKEAARREKSRHRVTDIYRRITPDYYGWRDEEDGVLLEIERQAAGADNDDADAVVGTKEYLRSRKNNSNKNNNKRRRIGNDPVGKDSGADKEREDDDDGDHGDDGDYLGSIPTQTEIERMLLEEKKKALLAKYAL